MRRACSYVRAPRHQWRRATSAHCRARSVEYPHALAAATRTPAQLPPACPRSVAHGCMQPPGAKRKLTPSRRSSLAAPRAPPCPRASADTSNFLDGSLTGTKEGAVYRKYAGVCLETQSFPDGPNRRTGEYPTAVLRPGEVYRHTTVYRFGIAPPP